MSCEMHCDIKQNKETLNSFQIIGIAEENDFLYCGEEDAPISQKPILYALKGEVSWIFWCLLLKMIK